MLPIHNLEPIHLLHVIRSLPPSRKHLLYCLLDGDVTWDYRSVKSFPESLSLSQRPSHKTNTLFVSCQKHGSPSGSWLLSFPITLLVVSIPPAAPTGSFLIAKSLWRRNLVLSPGVHGLQPASSRADTSMSDCIEVVSSGLLRSLSPQTATKLAVVAPSVPQSWCFVLPIPNFVLCVWCTIWFMAGGICVNSFYILTFKCVMQ